MQNRTTQRRITRWAQFLSSRAGYQRRQTRCAKRSVCNPILPVRTLPSLPCCASKETRPGPRQRRLQPRKSPRVRRACKRQRSPQILVQGFSTRATWKAPLANFKPPSSLPQTTLRLTTISPWRYKEKASSRRPRGSSRKRPSWILDSSPQMTEPPEPRQSKNYLTNQDFFGTLPSSLSGQGVQIPSGPNRKSGDAVEAHGRICLYLWPSGSRLAHKGCLGFYR